MTKNFMWLDREWWLAGVRRAGGVTDSMNNYKSRHLTIKEAALKAELSKAQAEVKAKLMNQESERREFLRVRKLAGMA